LWYSPAKNLHSSNQQFTRHISLNAIDGRADTTAVKIEGSVVVSIAAKRERSGGIKLEAVKPKLREGDLGVDVAASGQTEKLESISVILVYNDKSHEDLRWEHYQLCSSTPTNAQFGSKFGQNTSPFGQTAGFRPSNFFKYMGPVWIKLFLSFCKIAYANKYI
jgi:hypothetical protein